MAPRYLCSAECVPSFPIRIHHGGTETRRGPCDEPGAFADVRARGYVSNDRERSRAGNATQRGTSVLQRGNTKDTKSTKDTKEPSLLDTLPLLLPDSWMRNEARRTSSSHSF